jgi:hypothetical protein
MVDERVFDVCHRCHRPAQRYIDGMQFDGQVWFSFRNPDVWLFYRFVRELASAGSAVNLEWLPLPDPDEQTAMATFLAIAEPEQRGRFLHTMLGLIHIERQTFDDDVIVQRAVAVSDVKPGDVVASQDALSHLTETASSQGVVATPTVYRHGPASHIRLTDAALMGDTAATAALLLSVADNDGIWSVVKP